MKPPDSITIPEMSRLGNGDKVSEWFSIRKIASFLLQTVHLDVANKMVLKEQVQGISEVTVEDQRWHGRNFGDARGKRVYSRWRADRRSKRSLTTPWRWVSTCGPGTDSRTHQWCGRCERKETLASGALPLVWLWGSLVASVEEQHHIILKCFYIKQRYENAITSAD